MTLLTHSFDGSSMLSTGDYNTETEEMTVTFNGGRSYIYIDVPRRDWDELIAAKSAGKYFNLMKKTLVQK